MNEKLRVYFNLHKNLLSIQARVNGSWKVLKHTRQICLENVRFKVSEAGRQRVIRDKRKNVHAFVEGVAAKAFNRNKLPTAIVTYNPYELERFHDGEKYVDTADSVRISGKQVSAVNAR